MTWRYERSDSVGYPCGRDVTGMCPHEPFTPITLALVEEDLNIKDHWKEIVSEWGILKRLEERFFTGCRECFKSLGETHEGKSPCLGVTTT